MIPVAQFDKHFECEYFSLDEIDVKGGWSMLCPQGSAPKSTQLLYVLSSQNAVIKASNEKIASPIKAEEIYAVLPGEKVTVEGSAKIMKISAK